MTAAKLEEDLCRCCHSEGAFRSIAAVTEDVVYCDMLRECYGIELVALTDPLYRTLCTICDTCIQRLRDAMEFKEQVQECENVFRDLYLRRTSEGDDEVEVDVDCQEVRNHPEIDPKAEDASVTNYDDFEVTVQDGEDHSLQVKEERECDDFRMGEDGEDFQLCEEETSIPQAKEETKHKQIKLPILKGKKKKRVVCRRRKVARPKKKQIVDTIEEQYIRAKKEAMPLKTYINTKRKETRLSSSLFNATQKQQHNANNELLTHDTILKEKHEVNASINNVAPPMDKEIVDGVQAIEEQPPPVSLRSDFDYKWINKRFQCLRCEYNCARLKNMNQHLKKKHKFDPQFNCTLCPKKFLTLFPFVEHKLEEHNIDDRFKCTACDKTFSTKCYLQMHMDSFHMLGEKFKCELCDYETFISTHINRHKKVHSNERNFHCKFCRKSFKRKSTLQFHEMIHTGDKRQVCKECGQAFVQKASLNYHMSKYHPEVDF